MGSLTVWRVLTTLTTIRESERETVGERGRERSCIPFAILGVPAIFSILFLSCHTFLEPLYILSL